MPKYDYRCSACGLVYEKREGFDAPAVQPCPQCAGSARRLLTTPAIVFKGSGWYVTDSRKSTAGSASSASKGDEKPESAKTDATPSPAPAESTNKTEPSAKAASQ